FHPLHSVETANVPGRPLYGPEGWQRVRATPRRDGSPAHRSSMAQTTPSAVAGTTGEPPFAVLVVDGNEEHQILSVAALTRSSCPGSWRSISKRPRTDVASRRRNRRKRKPSRNGIPPRSDCPRARTASG